MISTLERLADLEDGGFEGVATATTGRERETDGRNVPARLVFFVRNVKLFEDIVPFTLVPVSHQEAFQSEARERRASKSKPFPHVPLGCDEEATLGQTRNTTTNASRAARGDLPRSCSFRFVPIRALVHLQ